MSKRLTNQFFQKAVAYVRYSSDNQRAESIEAQLRGIEQFAKQKHILIIKVYSDEAKSATTDKRPNFQQMIEDSKTGQFSMVIVHKLDRFSRNRQTSSQYKAILKSNGVRLVSVLENLDDTPESIILESMLEGMAEYYSANLAREVMKGMTQTALQCRHTGGTPPLGYDVTSDKTYVINEEEAQAVKLIFEMYLASHSYTEIINRLNDLGFKTKAGNSFSKNGLNTILSNEKYSGVYIFNKDAAKKQQKLISTSEMIRVEDAYCA